MRKWGLGASKAVILGLLRKTRTPSEPSYSEKPVGAGGAMTTHKKPQFTTSNYSLSRVSQQFVLLKDGLMGILLVILLSGAEFDTDEELGVLGLLGVSR
jgi:hypothetical protein